MTLGQRLSGRLPTPGVRPAVGAQSNPAAAAAPANRATPTPDTSQCPATQPQVELEALPEARAGAIDAMIRFLNAGGTVDELRAQMITEWDAFGETGYLREDVDLTGEGQPELVLGYNAPGDVGTLLILGCQAGRYVQRYESIADGLDPPTLIWLGDMNNNPPAEVVFARRQCSAAESCEFQTLVIAWSAQQGRFVNLLPDELFTLEIPAVRDMDNDEVAEVVVELNSNGTAATGPLRTGVNIYDWNGQLYLLSIIQLDAPRYRIQLVHEGDRHFSHLRMQEALQLYEAALAGDDLRYWFNDEPESLTSYVLYRRILAYAYLGNGGGIIETLTEIEATFPPPEDEGAARDELPVFVDLSYRFVDNLTQTNSLHEACTVVREAIEERQEALALMNRYGSRSPEYTALELCPY